MKYLKKYKLFESVNEAEIHSICKGYSIKNYTINSDGTIDVDGNVNIYGEDLVKLPLKFGKVTGYFNCSNNQLTSLEGSPKSVGGYFECSVNKLTSLEGSPKEVVGYFRCYNNNLTSLEGSPSSIGGDFYCEGNQLLNLLGAPKSVAGNFYCFNNNIMRLDGLEFKSFKEINIKGNPVYLIIKDWINNKNKEELIEYFIDMNVVQEGSDKPKLIVPRLEAFHYEMSIEMNINFNEVKKYYEIIK